MATVIPTPTSSRSDIVDLLLQLPMEERVSVIQEISPREAEALLYDWRIWQRPSQAAPPGTWLTWLVLAGRGFGKTRTGAEWVRQNVESGRMSRIALVAPTTADARDVMIEGESGLMAISPPWFKPLYEPSKRRLTWPNGAIATAYSADEPERLRGPQHDGAWTDEIAAWRYEEAWDMLMLGLRLGKQPQVVATTTPKPVELVRRLIKSGSTVITKGNTFENAANLSPAFIEQIKEMYEGTRLGQQEIYAEILDDMPGALWTRSVINATRVKQFPDGGFRRIVMGVDPTVSGGDRADETGIIIAGKDWDDEMHVIADLSLRATPEAWIREVIRAYYKYEVDLVVGEVNMGGDLVKTLLHSVDPDVPFKAVRAARGKSVRAEPIAALYERGKAHHLGHFTTLEDQLCSYIPGLSKSSPDRLDALVWAGTELMLRRLTKFRAR